MSLIKNILFKLLILIIFSFNFAQAEDLQKVAKFKDWEVIMIKDEMNKVCFAQSKPVLQSPKKSDREARLFVTFRPLEKISDEVSTTSGYEYNSQNSIIASSGKSNPEIAELSAKPLPSQLINAQFLSLPLKDLS